MNKHICPRCDRIFPEWQPIHPSCLVGRLRPWLFGIGGVILLILLSVNYQNIVAFARVPAEEKISDRTPSQTSQAVKLVSSTAEVTRSFQPPASTDESEVPTPTKPRPTRTLTPLASGAENSTSDPVKISTPTPSATFTFTPTPRPTSTSTSTPQPTSTPIPQPTLFTCSKSARGEFAAVWQHYGTKLGCPIQETPLSNSQTAFVEQPFAQGHMFYFESGPIKFVIVKYGTGTSGTWQSFSDNWDGQNDNHCFEAQEIQPRIVRGFNLIWCLHPEIREPLGWPVDIERNLDLELSQGFEKGFIIRDSDGYTNRLVYVFFNDGMYERVPY